MRDIVKRSPRSGEQQSRTAGNRGAISEMRKSDQKMVTGPQEYGKLQQTVMMIRIRAADCSMDMNGM
ncbi:uncharacterized protein LAESUDRAFT_722042 [Laetiporus sulphureus 93-53]|uniref:Uncharacterized protein n=1 Tax=Laetiporus sulphureus 93-53 TaxID=1314785 RepID=A0A165G6H7_9APHY|nr:uncharacterized protein LAESUDRAFT_722042 [Laetiporus sulphureus 93-53]KZT09893.1 hypothetical protein LAESUDRAFT_722042 [Laetiporus sulphureus 93-53]